MIEFTDVVKSYSADTQALKGINMQIDDGEFVYLVGPSGSGKSTIIKLITGELKPTSGTVHVNGYSLEHIRRREIPYLRRTVGVVFQDFRLIESKSVYDNVAFAMRVIGAKTPRSGSACPMFWTWLVWRTRVTVCPRSFPAVSSSVWPLPEPW